MFREVFPAFLTSARVRVAPSTGKDRIHIQIGQQHQKKPRFSFLSCKIISVLYIPLIGSLTIMDYL